MGRIKSIVCNIKSRDSQTEEHKQYIKEVEMHRKLVYFINIIVKLIETEDTDCSHSQDQN